MGLVVETPADEAFVARVEAELEEARRRALATLRSKRVAAVPPRKPKRPVGPAVRKTPLWQKRREARLALTEELVSILD